MHRVHKPGDQRCTKEFIEEECQFYCPKCDKTFSTSNTLNSHLEKEHEPFQQEFSGFSLVSDASISNLYEKCTKCERLFENEFDRMNHEERFHEYGESFELYPCEQCGFRGSDIVSIRRHISETHNSVKTNCVSLEALGISRLPEVTTRRKHNFSDLNINDDGDIDVDDEETDENFNLSSEDVNDVNLNESPIRKSSKRKITSVVSPKKRS